ncbi:MAG: rhomboid family intramembrane serine protease [Bacteroidota bacterium]
MAYRPYTWTSEHDARRYYRPSFFGGFSLFPPVIKTLLISNVTVFLFLFLLGPLRIGRVPVSDLLISWFGLFPLEGGFYPWQVFTYMFLHGGFFHLFFNMFALWMFGMEIENSWGSKKFLLYYLLCGVGAALSNLFVAPIFGATGPTVGASGAIYGVLLAFGLLFPDRYVFMFPFFVPVKAKYLVSLFILLEVFYGVTGTSDGVAHFAHLGGAAIGYLYLLVDRRRLPFEGIFNRVRVAWNSGRYRRSPYGSEQYNRSVADARFSEIHESQEKSEDETTQEKIDAILDKISVSGYQSLTEDEKRMLFEASKKLS